MIPRGIEILVKKASVDSEFKRHLLAERADAATRIGLELTIAEVDMLNGIPQSQLIAIIGSTRVSPRLRPAFMGYAAAAMLATIGVAIVGCGEKKNEADNSEIGEINDEYDILNEDPKRRTSDVIETGIRPGIVVGAYSLDTTALISAKVRVIKISGVGNDDPNRYIEEICLHIEPYTDNLVYSYYRVLNKYPHFNSLKFEISFDIEPDGSVESIVLKSNEKTKSSKELENEVIKSINEWQFLPASGLVTLECKIEFWNGYRNDR